MNGRQRNTEQIFKLQCLDASRVEHRAMVIDAGVFKTLCNLFDLCDTFGQNLVIAEHAAVVLHDHLELITQYAYRFTITVTFSIPALHSIDRRLQAVVVYRAVIAVLRQIFDNVIGRGAAEYQDIEQRIPTEPVGAMD